MKRSTDRILTSHVGRLPSPKSLEALAGKPEYFDALPAATRDIVRQQVEIGLDVINDGEFGKVGGFSNYVRTRLTGYEQKPLAMQIGREQREEFPEYSVGRVGGRRPEGAPQQMQMVCTGPVTYVGEGELQRDIRNMKQAIEGQPVVDVFMAAVSPDNVNYQPRGNEYYKSEEEYIRANAAALKHEYQAIAAAGFVLQIDMPVMKYNALSLSLEEFRRRFAFLIEVLNDALAGIPPDQVRAHICYGGMKIAHTGDLMLNQFLDILLKLNANGISYDQNVRHDHEWNIFKETKLPDGKLLMPGVAAHTTDTVEHPELIAERLTRLANLVGRENVIAGTDCGLGGRVHPEIAWAKFRSMAEGARIATKQLWAKA
ncbi:MAG TPA: cobalamin-independent methionine synthase II family protein [Chloroflexota bacterium]|nr:cobalamin-independent methionine synthase II family protein [Chloroflexota bacterium]